MGANHWSKKVMSNQEAVYLAGFFDGEGSLFCIKLKDKPNLRCGYSIRVQASIAQTSLPVLEYIQSVSGNGRINECRNRKPNHKRIWVLRWQPNQLRHILPQILPYLIVKRQVVEKGLELLRLKEGCPTYSKNNQEQQFSLYNEICSLNRRGLDVRSVEFNGIQPAKIKAAHERRKKGRLCEVEGCGAKHYAKGTCFKHYRKANPQMYKRKWITVGVRGVQTCLVCGKQFEYYRKTPKFCSALCRKRYNKQAEKERRGIN